MQGCPEMAPSAGRMRDDFMYRHFRSEVVVLQVRRDPLPCCNMCGIHIPAGRLLKHHRTDFCFKNA